MKQQSGPSHPWSRHIGIGSDFEDVEQQFTVPQPLPLPWFHDRNGVYLESGRQGFVTIEKALRSQGHRRLYVPEYLCDSMLQAFDKDHWQVVALPVSNDLAIDCEIISGLRGGVLLHCKYFGVVETDPETSALRIAQNSGVVIIADETHRVFSPPSAVADFRIASLRKLLPIPQGAYVVGISPDHVSIRSDLSRPPLIRIMAMSEKARAQRTGDNVGDYRALFLEAENELSQRLLAVQLDSRSLALLGHLNLELLRAQRVSNSQVLFSLLGSSDQFTIVNPPSSTTIPSHLVLKTERAHDLRTYLSDHAIYCPVHWGPSRLLAPRQWPRCYLSIPIDHRYGLPEMKVIAQRVHEYFEKKIGARIS